MSKGSLKGDTSFAAVAERLNGELAGVPLLAMGQTAYWDEPVKAILAGLLAEQVPGARMLAGIHDADYFSKVPASLGLSEGWFLLPHNDGGTKDLWVAAGEISALFGSESIPTRERLAKYGAKLDKLARDYPGGRDALVDSATEAWGWRGLAYVNTGNETACCIRLSDAVPHLLRLIRWGLDSSLNLLSDGDAERGAALAEAMTSEVEEYARAHPEGYLPDLFCSVLRSFYVRLMGYEPANVEMTRAHELFRFNRETAGLPRFNILRAFLDPETRSASQESYDLAVEGSDTYTLDRFAPGAIPFDLVVPCEGRGAICLREGRVVIDLETPVEIPTQSPVTSVEELAGIVEDRFGKDVALIGKALTLVLMMAGEFIFVLHEEASAYVPRCERMATLLQERGVPVRFYPILRMNYHTWDSLRACDTTLRLPGHLAAAFGQSEVTAPEFADSWRSVVACRRKTLLRLEAATSVEDLLLLLDGLQPGVWEERLENYRSAYASVRRISDESEPLKSESVRLRDLSHQIKQSAQELDARKGAHFRTALKPVRDRIWEMESSGVASGPEYDSALARLAEEEKTRAGLDAEIARLREDASAAHARSLELKARVQAIESGNEAREARKTLKLVEYEAELSRLWIAREAILVSEGLSYTNHRPTAWWFPLVDPQMRWLARVAETAEFRFEEIGA